MTKLSESVADPAVPLKPVRTPHRKMRPPRADSPKLTRHNLRSDSLRQRCNDRNTDEIIRFVRDLQFERQPTLLRLQKKAPLPSIGQASPPKAGTNDSGFLDRTTDSNDSEDDDMLDNEISVCTSQRKSQPIDPFFIDILTCPRSSKQSIDFKILSRSTHQARGQIDCYNNNTKTPARHSFNRRAGTSRQLTNAGASSQSRLCAKQLPPLSRDCIPERPSAPSPSRTPPLSDYGYIEEESVDYIDLS